jgi:hypothetical protein
VFCCPLAVELLEKIWKSGNLDLEGQKIWNGWPANRSRFFAKSQKSALKKSGVTKS